MDGVAYQESPRWGSCFRNNGFLADRYRHDVRTWHHQCTYTHQHRAHDTWIAVCEKRRIGFAGLAVLRSLAVKSINSRHLPEPFLDTIAPDVAYRSDYRDHRERVCVQMGKRSIDESWIW